MHDKTVRSIKAPAIPAQGDGAPGERDARVYLVSRHPGAIAWMRRHLAAPDAVLLAHVDDQHFAPGDVVAGVLPMWLAARACADGARVLALDLRLSPAQRGRELGVAELDAAGARLVPYDVHAVMDPADPHPKRGVAHARHPIRLRRADPPA